VSLDNLFTSLSSDLSSANSLSEIEEIEDRMDGWYDTIEDILRYTVEHSRGEDFRQAVKMSNQDFVFVDPRTLESDISVLEMDLDRVEDPSKEEEMEKS
jgi:hypothetical protein